MTRRRRLRAPLVDPARGEDEAKERIFHALEASFKKRIKHARKPLALALSGGYDSRLLAAIGKKVGASIQAFTYGRSYHREVYFAKMIAKTLKLSHRVVSSHDDGLLRHLALHLETIEGQSDLGTAQIGNVLDIPNPPGTPLLIGFLGETVAGEHLAWLHDSDFDDLDGIANGIVRGYSNRQSFEKQLFDEAELSQEAYREEVRHQLLQDCHPYQALMIWDLENRQRRFIGSHCQILGSRFDVIAPNYDLEVINAWFSLPRITLMGSYFFHRFLVRYFPELAKIPHPAEPEPITPNLKIQLKLFAYWQVARFVRKLGVDLGSDIDRLWCALTPKRESGMISRIKNLAGELEKSFGVSLKDDFGSVVQGHPQVVRNLFLIAEYSAWLLGTQKGVADSVSNAAAVEQAYSEVLWAGVS